MKNEAETISIIEPFPALIKAVKNILYPFVHLLMRTGIPFPKLAELLKEVYIEVADKQFRLNEKKQTQTRLSFLTGIHRKDVKRLQNSKRDSEEPENISVGVKLISKWMNEARFLNDAGEPLLLPLKALKDSNNPSFEELVKTICKQDIRSRVVLDEWLNLGIVKLRDAKVKLISDAYIPKESQNEKAFFLGHNISDHLNAASQNLLNDSPEFFERCVYYDDLSDESIAELQKMVKKNGMDLLKKLNKRASLLKQQDMLKEGSKQRINMGLYAYHQSH